MTTTIGLITTGRCEHRALAPSIARVFADRDVELRTLYAAPFDSLTSGRVTYPAPVSRAPALVDKLVDRIAAEAGRRGGCDLVLAIDDLELPNVATPEHVTRLVRDAALRCLGATPTHGALERFRGRCSFHLLCPMVEAYFFGEPAARARAGAARPAVLDPARHLEAFRAADADYLGAPDEPGHAWRTADRADHPKRYLRYLAGPGAYRETRGGCAALRELDWAQVFAHPPPGIAFARSLFDDLADALGAPSPFPGPAHPLTARKPGGVLRNL
jgi:hypothetical protein